VKRCPTCNKTFNDQNLSFCVDDGTPLVPVEKDDEETIVSPSAGASAPVGQSSVPAYQPPGSYVPPGGQGPRRKTWPWLLGCLGIGLMAVVGIAIMAKILFPRLLMRTPSGNANANVQRSENYNSRSDEDDTPAPTDEQKVLSDLTDLEHEWTVANINADKKKLDRILADDYVGTGADGKPQGKADYLRTIQRDQTIQKWAFEDLNLNLKGDRATLSGIVRLQIEGQDVAYRFTDKFVWREGRWQATGSEVTRIE
jgi:hypothetical protein